MQRGSDNPVLGKVLDGRYRIDREIGAGGFGTVYAGLHLTLAQPVAIKVFRLSADATSERRAELLAGFVEEARLLSALRHDNIVRMLDQGFMPADESGVGAPYAVMEYCPDGSLRELIQSSAPLPLKSALPLIECIVAGVRHAHERGIAHRDLKPGNVMLSKTPSGMVPRIIDFGIAKLIDEGELPGSGATRTRSSAISYTPAYAAPEQAIGGRTGVWTDVHAIGLIFCELLTGQLPYGRSDLTLKIIDPARPTPAAFGVDAGPFEALIAKCLSIRPDERYADATVLGVALAEAIRAMSLSDTVLRTSSVPAARPTSRRTLLLGAGAAGVAGAAAWLALRGDEPVAPGEPEAESAALVVALPSSAIAATASSGAPEPITLASISAGQVLERMLEAGLAPVTPPAADAPTNALMVSFKHGINIGAVYLNEVAIPEGFPPAAHPLAALMHIRSWIAADRKQGFELAYLVHKKRVLSMSWGPKPGERALGCFRTLSLGLPFDTQGSSWFAPDPTSDATLTKPLWFAKRLSELTTVELLFRLEAVKAARSVAEHEGHLLASLSRGGKAGELVFYPRNAGADNASVNALFETLRQKKKRFVFARDGTTCLVAHGPLADEAFVRETLSGLTLSLVSDPA